MSRSRKQAAFDEGTAVKITMPGKYQGMRGEIVRRSYWQDPQTSLIRYEIFLSNGHYLTADRSGFKPIEHDSGRNGPQGTDDRPPY